MHLSNAGTYNDTAAANTMNRTNAFSNLSPEARLRYNALGTEVDFSRGDALFVEGQPSQCVYIVLSGRVKLSVTSRDGKTMIVRIAEAGDVLGLSAAMNAADYEVSAQAFEFCRIKAVRAQDFIEFLKKYPDAAMIATQCILREYKMMFKDVCRLGLPTTVAGRLANLLLDWVHTRPQPGQTSRVTMTLTQEEIAGMTATSRETVSRVLQQFQRDKLISIKGVSLTVLQPAALEQLAV
ncbi:MAG: Crp/Fnr family transcriptional regulator [Acidobacteriia bacterium]|nr:Crp/Fnr family transcriptional regulator [Terriglobia bacterium]